MDEPKDPKEEFAIVVKDVLFREVGKKLFPKEFVELFLFPSIYSESVSQKDFYDLRKYCNEFVSGCSVISENLKHYSYNEEILRNLTTNLKELKKANGNFNDKVLTNFKNCFYKCNQLIVKPIPGQIGDIEP